jgi:ferritin
MLKPAIEKILNEQIIKEAYSAHFYLSMASWAERNGLEGTAEWLYVQVDEEKMHMLKFIHYINGRGGKAVIPGILTPPAEFGDIAQLFKAVLKHEEFISESINEIVGVTIEEKDYTTHNWIQWFVTEQIEEEATVNAILDKINLLNGQNYYLFDRDLKGSRTAAASPEAN